MEKFVAESADEPGHRHKKAGPYETRNHGQIKEDDKWRKEWVSREVP